MKKVFRPYYLSVAFALALASCGPAKIIPTPVENIDKMPLKTAPLKEKDLKRWSHLDLVKDTVPGMSVDKAYAELLKGKKGQKVIVGIVDSGVDINHEDLKAVIWTNPKEIAGNNIDDDKNGYVDDIHGWNFLGDAVHEQLELTRIVKKGPSAPDYEKAKAALEKEIQDLQGNKQQLDFILKAEKTIKDHLKKDSFTLEEVKAIQSDDTNVKQAKAMFTQILSGTSKADFDKEIVDFKDYVYGQLDYNLNVNFDGRKIVGDNPDDINDTKYGNNNVIGPEPKEAKHGTHVAGIVAQVRGNKLGGDGVTNNALIMAVRAVPNGDEYDKDIALGIRYAGDNGAVKVSPWWLVASYGVITVGELCLSPMGLSFVSKLSPARITALMMGGFFLANSVGNKLSGILASTWYSYDNKMNYFLVNFALLIFATLLGASMLKRLNKIMKDQGH